MPVASLTVVVPAHRAEQTIARCVEALLRQTLPRGRYEVVVVDDASPDGTADAAEEAGARVVRLGENRGPGGARNAGIEAARGELVAFTDADCEPGEGFLEALVAPLLADPAVGGTKGTYLTRQRALVARFVQLEYESRYARMAGRETIDFVDTYAACFRRRDLVEIGGFDTRLRQCQDQELSFRLAARGVRILFVPEAQTYHLHEETLRGYLAKKRRIAWWKVAVLRRHPKKAVSDSHTPQTLKLEMLAALGVAGSALALPVLAALGAWPLGALALGAFAAAFAALCAPFTLRALRRDMAVGLAAPAILLLRDLALALGLARGIVRPPQPGGAGAQPLLAEAWAAPEDARSGSGVASGEQDSEHDRA